jgi:hypothetical protein
MHKALRLITQTKKKKTSGMRESSGVEHMLTMCQARVQTPLLCPPLKERKNERMRGGGGGREGREVSSDRVLLLFFDTFSLH